MTTLTDDEQKLLHQCHWQIGHVVAAPESGISRLRDSHASGCERDFRYEVTSKSLNGEWCRYEVVERLKDGEPCLLRFDEPHLRISITWTRLRQWATNLPAELRARALVAWSVHPVNTRNLTDLAAITHEAITLSAPMEQLELFSDPQSMAVTS